MTDAPVEYDVRPVTLIPHDDAAGRSLTAVIAILTFLACLCAGGAVWLAAATAAWRSDVGTRGASESGSSCST